MIALRWWWNRPHEESMKFDRYFRVRVSSCSGMRWLFSHKMSKSMCKMSIIPMDLNYVPFKWKITHPQWFGRYRNRQLIGIVIFKWRHWHLIEIHLWTENCANGFDFVDDIIFFLMLVCVCACWLQSNDVKFKTNGMQCNWFSQFSIFISELSLIMHTCCPLWMSPCPMQCQCYSAPENLAERKPSICLSIWWIWNQKYSIIYNKLLLSAFY